MIEAGVIAGYVIAWAVRKVRRAAARAGAAVDGTIDRAVDSAVDRGMGRLREAVVAKLRGHPALADLDQEAARDGRASELTRQQIELAITGAARDEEFRQSVTALLAQVRQAERAAGVSVTGAGATVFTGDSYPTASGGGIAIGQVGGDVYTGSRERAGMDPTEPGRSQA